VFNSSELRQKKFGSRTWSRRRQRSLTRATKGSDGHGNALAGLSGCDVPMGHNFAEVTTQRRAIATY
jgi:hypothetical protein